MAAHLPRFTLLAPPTRPNPRLRNPPPSQAQAWTGAIAQLPEDLQGSFTVVEAKLDALDEDQKRCDCVVSPANSFGIMDGGYDMALSRSIMRSGDVWTLTNICQEALASRYRGYLPPGGCLITPLPEDLSGPSNNAFGARSIAIVPTMRTPEDVSWHRDLVFNSMWSLLLELARWNEGHPNDQAIKTVLMTGLGTGQGGISAEKCAQQMMLAVRYFAQGWGDRPRWADVAPRTNAITKTEDF